MAKENVPYHQIKIVKSIKRKAVKIASNEMLNGYRLKNATNNYEYL